MLLTAQLRGTVDHVMPHAQATLTAPRKVCAKISECHNEKLAARRRPYISSEMAARNERKREKRPGSRVIKTGVNLSQLTKTGARTAGAKPEHYGKKPGHFETSKIDFPTSEGVGDVSERANE